MFIPLAGVVAELTDTSAAVTVLEAETAPAADMLKVLLYSGLLHHQVPATDGTSQSYVGVPPPVMIPAPLGRLSVALLVTLRFPANCRW